MTLAELINGFLEIIVGYFVPIVFGLASLYFLVGALKYLKSGGSSEKRKEGAKFMFFAILALFLMLTIWAIVGVFSGFLGSDVGIPQFRNATPDTTPSSVL